MPASPETQTPIDTAAAHRIRLLALDVDGILSDGRLYYDDDGRELKAFHVRDGLGIKMLQRSGVTVAIITGRSSPMVDRRAREIGIKHVVQGREDKAAALVELTGELAVAMSDCAYMGDDLPDLAALRAAGLALTVADAVPEVRAVAQWQSSLPGGAGAVREACEALLKARGQWAARVAELP